MQPHGSFELSVKNQIVIIKAMGAWNFEMAVEFGEQYKALVLTFNQDPWACLIDLTEWELFTPEASDYLDDINRWADANNQRFEAVVCGLSIQQSLLEKNQAAFTHVETQFCESLDLACQWLESKFYAISSDGNGGGNCLQKNATKTKFEI